MPGVTTSEPIRTGKAVARLRRACGAILVAGGGACVYWLPPSTGGALVTPEQCLLVGTAVVCLIAGTVLLGFE